MKAQVICIPGSVAPAAQRYKPLIDGVIAQAEYEPQLPRTSFCVGSRKHTCPRCITS